MNGFARSLIAAVALLSTSVAARADDSVTTAPPAPESVVASQPASDELEALAAIALAAQGDNSAAYAQFDAILKRNPEDPVALYWAGLIEMRRGLDLRRAGDDPAKKAEARVWFQRAHDHLKSLIDSSKVHPDIRRIRPVEAGLTLGIAQLADDNAGQRKERAADAIRTLRDYNGEMEKSEAGPDYLGYFFLGIAHWRLATYGNQRVDRDEAQKAFSRALELAPQTDPNAPPPSAGVPPPPTPRETVELYTNYYYAIIDIQDRNLPHAIELLDRVARDAEKFVELNQLRADANQLKSDAEKSGAGYQPLGFKSPVGFLEFRGDVELGNGYDSNVLLLGDGTSLPRYIPKQQDYFMHFQAGADVSRRLENPNGGKFSVRALTVGVGGDTTERWQPSIGEYDIAQYRGRAFAQWEFPDDWISYWEYQYSDTELGREPFIGSHGAYFNLTKRFPHPDIASYGDYVSAYYQYESRTYYDPVRDPRLDRDGNYHLVGLRLSHDLLRADHMWAGHYEGKSGKSADNDRHRWMRAFVGYEYRDERTQGNEFDYHGHTGLAGIEIPLPYRLKFDYGVRLYWDDYNSYSLYDFAREPRADFGQVHTVGLEYTILGRGESTPETLDIRLRGAADFTIQDSNVTDSTSEDVYSYGRQQYFLGLRISF